MLWIPEVGYLLKHQTELSSIIFSIHCTAVLYLAMVSLTWIPYRCCLSLFLLALCGALIGVMMIGEPMTLKEGLEVYQANGYE